jgi:hypothetical protein
MDLLECTFDEIGEGVSLSMTGASLDGGKELDDVDVVGGRMGTSVSCSRPTGVGKLDVDCGASEMGTPEFDPLEIGS